MNTIPVVTERIGFVQITNRGNVIQLDTPAGHTTTSFARDLRGALDDAFLAGQEDARLSAEADEFETAMLAQDEAGPARYPSWDDAVAAGTYVAQD